MAETQSEEQDFLFDVVVTNVKLKKGIKDPALLDAMVKFAGNTLAVTNSRINVSDFVANRQFLLSISPDSLRTKLEENGLPVTVRYEKSSQGNAVIEFPDTFLDKIGSTMNDLYHEVTVPLMRKADTTGTVSLRMMLTIKCAESEQEPEERKSSSKRSTAYSGSSRAQSVVEVPPPKKEEKVDCVRLGPTINPQDVIFVIGDPDPLLKIPEPDADVASEEGDERLRLDLQRYKSLDNRRVIFPDDDPCLKQTPSFAQLKKLTEEYSQIIDSVTEKVRRMPTTDAPIEKTTVPPPTSHEVQDERWIPVPLGSDEDEGVKPIRFCPVCLYSMSWLPRYASCPQCQCKPRPVLRADHPAVCKKLTADEIVAEQLVRPQAPDGAEDFCMPPCEAAFRRAQKKRVSPMVDSDSDAECPPCRCTCKEGKTCAHCRIRQLCEDIFEGADKPEEKQEKRPMPQPHSSEDFCVPEPEDDDRPYLARVFSEMKSLYALHDNKKLLEIKKRCASQSLLTMRPKSSGHDLNQSQQAASDGHLPGSFDRQRAGHKHCLPTEVLVPRRHGWAWHRSREARKFGWRPGAILRAAEQVMRYFLCSKEDGDSYSKILADYESQQAKSLPILNICKREGEIFVTLRGKEDKTITFRIVKSQLAVALRQIKSALKEQGFNKCTCHKSLTLCTCRDDFEKIELNKALRTECRRRLMQPCPETLVLTDTSISDLEFDLDVDPRPRRCTPQVKAIQNTVNHGTQTVRKIPPLYPVPDNSYWRAFDCAAGDRYMGTAFGEPEETVFEDGIFGYRGGGQHGKCPFWRDERIWNMGGGAPLRIGTARNAIDPHRFGRSVWRGVPKKILRQMKAKSLIR